MRELDEIRADHLTHVTADNPLSARWAIGAVQQIIEAQDRLLTDIPDRLDALTEKDAKIERLEAALIEAREPVSDATAALIAATLQRGTPVLWEKER